MHDHIIHKRKAMADRQDWAHTRARLESGSHFSTPTGPRSLIGYKILSGFIEVAGVILKGLGLHRRGVRNALDVRTEYRTFSFPDLPPAFDGYRILHLTDLHLDALDGLAEAARKAIMNCEADVCIVTGDYNDDPRGSRDIVLQRLRHVFDGFAPADGVYAILGNHDDHRMASDLEAMGLTTLINESVTVLRGGDRIHLTGLDDIHHFYTPAALDALDEITPGFAIALVHSAEFADEAAARGYAFYLCGHTHGGQICRPDGRPIVTRMYRNKKFSLGSWQCGAMKGYTGRGTGVSGPPVRYFSKGEVAHITLRREGPTLSE